MFAKKHPSRFILKTKQFLLWIISHCNHAEKLEIYRFLKDGLNRKEKSVIKPTKGEKAGKKAKKAKLAKNIQNLENLTKKTGKNLSRKARRQLEKDILAGKLSG